jgi:hypothetical protein
MATISKAQGPARVGLRTALKRSSPCASIGSSCQRAVPSPPAPGGPWRTQPMTRSWPSAKIEALMVRGMPTVALAGSAPHSTTGRGCSIATRAVGGGSVAAARGRRGGTVFLDVANGRDSGEEG